MDVERLLPAKKDEEGTKRIDKVLVDSRKPDAVRYVEKKLWDKGVLRLDGHPVDGLGGLGQGPPKSGRGGKYTWEGPGDLTEAELGPAPPAVDEKDPNYVPEEEVVDPEVVVGEVEVSKVAEAREGVARVEVHPPLQPSLLEPQPQA